jgi:hypothetical protein
MSNKFCQYKISLIPRMSNIFLQFIIVYFGRIKWSVRYFFLTFFILLLFLRHKQAKTNNFRRLRLSRYQSQGDFCKIDASVKSSLTQRF